MSLSAANDEQQLITLLQEFCRLRRKQVDVYFDNAPPGNMPVRKYGAVTAHFVRSGKTADTAIRERLTRLNTAAKNWVVVSSDQAVQGSARAARAKFVSSEAFAREIAQAIENNVPQPGKQEDAALNADEVEEWMALFSRGRQ
jgi:predicted RNA-binding protein with PIN domain